MNQESRIIFFGTPEFAVSSLKALIEAKFNIVAIVTKPDKPVGRNKTLTPPPVKVFAEKYDIEVLQPAQFSNLTIQQFNNQKPDLYVIVAYGKILPPDILAIPKYGAINVHPSLLPKYRGPSPLQNQILNNELEVAVSIMLLDEEMDHGAILAQFQISNFKTQSYNYETLGKELFDLGAKHLTDTIESYLAGEIKPLEQDHSQATITKLIKKEDGLINWSQTADYIERMTRAYYPWPCAYVKLKMKNKKRKTIEELSLRILKTRVSSEQTDLKPGTLFKTSSDELNAACGQSTVLIIDELQPAGKRKMTSQEFMRGHNV